MDICQEEIEKIAKKRDKPLGKGKQFSSLSMLTLALVVAFLSGKEDTSTLSEAGARLSSAFNMLQQMLQISQTSLNPDIRRQLLDEKGRTFWLRRIGVAKLEKELTSVISALCEEFGVNRFPIIIRYKFARQPPPILKQR
jgi:hypothetical protein